MLPTWGAYRVAYRLAFHQGRPPAPPLLRHQLLAQDHHKEPQATPHQLAPRDPRIQLQPPQRPLPELSHHLRMARPQNPGQPEARPHRTPDTPHRPITDLHRRTLARRHPPGLGSRNDHTHPGLEDRRTRRINTVQIQPEHPLPRARRLRPRHPDPNRAPLPREHPRLGGQLRRQRRPHHRPGRRPRPREKIRELHDARTRRQAASDNTSHPRPEPRPPRDARPILHTPLRNLLAPGDPIRPERDRRTVPLAPDIHEIEHLVAYAHDIEKK